jgi:hypothetical protein
MKRVKLFEHYIKESSQETGLMVTGRTSADNNKIGDIADDLGYHAEWNHREGYWLFPEEEDMYDELEAELEKAFIKKKVNARFEGIFESVVTEAVSRATKIYQIATPAPKAMLVRELEDLFGDDYRHIVTEFDDDEGYESVLVFNLTKNDIKRIQEEIGDVLIWEYSIKKGKEIMESVVTEGISKDQMVNQIKRALKDGTSIFKLPMDTQKYYYKNKSDFESVVTEGAYGSANPHAKPAGLSKEETLQVAQKFAEAISKADGTKCTVNTRTLEEDSFDLDCDGEEFDGGSYNIFQNGNVMNMALPNNPVYGKKNDSIDAIVKNIKKMK